MACSIAQLVTSAHTNGSTLTNLDIRKVDDGNDHYRLVYFWKGLPIAVSFHFTGVLACEYCDICGVFAGGCYHRCISTATELDYEGWDTGELLPHSSWDYMSAYARIALKAVSYTPLALEIK